MKFRHIIAAILLAANTAFAGNFLDRDAKNQRLGDWKSGIEAGERFGREVVRYYVEHLNGKKPNADSFGSMADKYLSERLASMEADKVNYTEDAITAFKDRIPRSSRRVRG
jgi:hypothetical protein